MKLALGHFIQFPSPTPLHVLNNLNNIRMMLFMGFGFTSVYMPLLCCKALTKLGIEFDISFDTERPFESTEFENFESTEEASKVF